jgi:ATP-dependent protease ClpP protease subunit
MARRWVAVEEVDDNGCDPCNENDGKTYKSRAEAFKDYPNGVGFKDCIGAQYGNDCRGKVVKRGRKGTEDGMNAAEIVASNRSLLAAYRSKITNLHTPVDPKKIQNANKNWFRFENLGSDRASVFIYGEIGFWGVTADDFVQQLNTITAPAIDVHINSEGGEVWDGVAIHTAIFTHPAHVTTHIDGLAASAASFIAMAGDDIRMARNATMMIHDGATLAWGNPAELQEVVDLLHKVSDNIADIYSQQAGGTPEEWRAKMTATTWYTGQEALTAGLVDSITEKDKEDAPQNSLLSHLLLRNSLPDAPAEEEETPDPPAEETTETTEVEREEHIAPPPDDAPEKKEKDTPPPVDGWARQLQMSLLASQLS